MKNIGEYLELMADMHSFDDHAGDALGQSINRYSDSQNEEIFEDDLDFVSAAADYSKFFRHLSEEE